MHIDASTERILKEYKKKYELEEMPRARVTCPLEVSSVAAPSALPDCPENFGEQTWRLLNERADIAASTDNNRMVVIEYRTAEAEPLPHPDNFIDAAFCIKLKATIKVFSFLGWGVFIQQYQFNELDDRMSKLEKVKMGTSPRKKHPWNLTVKYLWTLR